MKKILLVLSLVIFTISGVWASNLVKITRMTNSIQIKRPDTGEINTYKDIDEIPKLMYGSKITASGGTAEIKFFNTASITLEKNQEIMILKNPVSKEIEISRGEIKAKKPKTHEIKVWLADCASATFGSDTKVSLFETYPSIVFKVVKGLAVVKGIGGKSYELKAGEYYEAKQNITH